MHNVGLLAPDDFDGWRKASRLLAATDVPADQILWSVASEAHDLFGRSEQNMPATSARPFPVPRDFLAIARMAVCHSDPERFSLLYALLRRLIANPAVFKG